MDSQFSTESYATGPPQRLCIHGSATVIRRPTRIRVGSAVVCFVYSLIFRPIFFRVAFCLPWMTFGVAVFHASCSKPQKALPSSRTFAATA